MEEEEKFIDKTEEEEVKEAEMEEEEFIRIPASTSQSTRSTPGPPSACLPRPFLLARRRRTRRKSASQKNLHHLPAADAALHQPSDFAYTTPIDSAHHAWQI